MTLRMIPCPKCSMTDWSESNIYGMLVCGGCGYELAWYMVDEECREDLIRAAERWAAMGI